MSTIDIIAHTIALLAIAVLVVRSRRHERALSTEIDERGTLEDDLRRAIAGKADSRRRRLGDVSDAVAQMNAAQAAAKGETK